MQNQEGNYYKPIVVAQQIINNQNCYLITKKGHSSWVSLAQAPTRLIRPILAYEQDRQLHHPYHPLEDHPDSPLQDLLTDPQEYRTKLRQKDLVPISKRQFHQHKSHKPNKASMVGNKQTGSGKQTGEEKREQSKMEGVNKVKQDESSSQVIVMEQQKNSGTNFIVKIDSFKHSTHQLHPSLSP